MDYYESVRGLTGSALDGIARALYERDAATFEEIVVRLTRNGTLKDYETAATMLSTAPMRAKAGNNNYTDARFGTLADDGYFDMYVNACKRFGLDESEYIKVMLAAQYAKRDGAFYAWDKSVDRYIKRLAERDFDRAADYIDRFDPKFGKYSVLIKVDRKRAVDRLVGIALYGKNVDKSAVRGVLMDYDEVSDTLISLYGRVNARERVAIVRLLLAYKNDGRVSEFLKNTVANDKSKSVRQAARSGMRAEKAKNVAAYVENLMAEGVALDLAQWKELFNDEKARNVADRIFFYALRGDGRISVLVYNDGRFLDSGDRPIVEDDALKIYVLHPLDVTADYAGILSAEINQPFLQIHRPIYHRLSGERYFSNRLAGTMIARDEFYVNLKRFGFTFCAKRSADEADMAVCRIGDYVIGAECDLPKCSDTASCGRIVYYNASDVVKLKRNLYISAAESLDLRSVPRREFSELTYRAYRLFGAV